MSILQTTLLRGPANSVSFIAEVRFFDSKTYFFLFLFLIWHCNYYIRFLLEDQSIVHKGVPSVTNKVSSVNLPIHSPWPDKIQVNDVTVEPAVVGIASGYSSLPN